MMIINIICRDCTKRNFRDSVIHEFYFVVLSPCKSLKRRSKCESKLSGRRGGAEELPPECPLPLPPPPSRELAPRQGTQLRREFHPLGGQNEKINFEEH